MTILILDNDQKTISKIKSLLEDTEYKTKIATNVDDAIKYLYSDLSISLILIEIDLPHEAGYKLLAFLKSNLRFSEIPAVINSKNADNKTVIKCIEKGAKDYMIKPINEDSFLTKIKNVLDMGKGKVLVVCNDQVVLNIFVRTLSRESYKVFTCDSGEEAVEFLKEKKTDYIISELNLPVMSGLDLLVILKDEYPQIPVVIAMENNSSLSEDDIIASGADGFIKKPYNNTELIHKINSLKNIKKKPARSKKSAELTRKMLSLGVDSK